MGRTGAAGDRRQGPASQGGLMIARHRHSGAARRAEPGIARDSGFDAIASPRNDSTRNGSDALSFVERHGLWSREQQEAASRLRKIVEQQKLEVIRLSFPDQHGILRGKTLVASEALASLESGCSITTTMLAKDTSHRTVFPVFTSGGGFGMKEMEGAADVLMVADPTTFRVLPWTPGTGWLMCDLHFADGRPVPFATRNLYRGVLDKLAQARLRLRRGPRGRIPHLQARRRQNVAGACRTAGHAARCQPAVARLPVSDRAALRPDGAGAGNHPARRAGARPAACARSRSSSARASANSPLRREPASSPPTTWCCFAAP